MTSVNFNYVFVKINAKEIQQNPTLFPNKLKKFDSKKKRLKLRCE